MCADEAEQFLDAVSYPHDVGHADGESIDAPDFELSGIRVFGDIALARITHTSGRFATLFFRRETGRWTVCADADGDLSLEQHEDNVWPAMPAEATRLMRTVDGLRRTPIGQLTTEDVRCLLQQNEGIDVLLPRAVIQLKRDPLAEGDLFPGDLLVTTLRVGRGHWIQDPITVQQMKIVIGKVRDLGDLTERGAPHEEIWKCVTDILTELPDREPDSVTDVYRSPVRFGDRVAESIGALQAEHVFRT
ncbi:contact-dependent growth inhibition system immunity protein [Nocardia sp. NPDC006044]|uniref:contact-dependent growth inhibition system immunity protein n=1 Tax=Nocardia sp. NPDC006044 TaxID=3364306 RepID=UPI00368F35D0